MAGTFYTQQEVAEKLGKSVEEIKLLVQEGRLHEFRDGTQLLFKVEEVEALVSEIAESGIDVSDTVVELKPDEAVAEDQTNQEPSDEGMETDIGTGDESEFDLDLGAISGGDASGSLGINVLGDTEDNYNLAETAQGETHVPSEASEQLSSLDGDLNMDSIGSGSGLLDLSLQADDTSLGAVLDDILPAGEAEAGVADEEEASVAEEADKIFENAEPQAETPVATAESVEPGVVRMPQYVEAAPDAVSRACGIALFLPLLMVFYAAIVVVAGFRGISPGVVEVLAPAAGPMSIIWYIVIGLSVLVVCIIGFAALLGGGKRGKGKRPGVYQQPGTNL